MGSENGAKIVFFGYVQAFISGFFRSCFIFHPKLLVNALLKQVFCFERSLTIYVGKLKGNRQ